MNLFEINSRIQEAIEKMFGTVNPETGEVEAGSVEELEELQATRRDKLDACGAYIKNLEAEAAALKAEADSLAKRAESKKKKAESIRNYVKAAMISAGEERFESTRVAFSFRSSEAVNISNEANLPKKYFVKKVTMQPDKAAIKKALKAGLKVRGAELVENQNLQVK